VSMIGQRYTKNCPRCPTHTFRYTAKLRGCRTRTIKTAEVWRETEKILDQTGTEAECSEMFTSRTLTTARRFTTIHRYFALMMRLSLLMTAHTLQTEVQTEVKQVNCREICTFLLTSTDYVLHATPSARHQRFASVARPEAWDG